MSYGFIILRHVNSELTNEYWNECVRCIRRFYPLRKIVVIDDNSNKDFVKADLLKDEGWDEAMKGCTYVLHVASPFVLAEPKNENELIDPAVEGTKRILAAAKRAKVKRVVLTSSTAAIPPDRAFAFNPSKTGTVPVSRPSARRSPISPPKA
jgi:nucleoside-diphosphate-sugar epimerase